MNKVKYAGFWIRFFASFLDTLFLALPVAVVVYFLSDGNWFDLQSYKQNLQYALNANPQKALATQANVSLKWEIVFEVAVFIVTILFWRKNRGATPGKKFVNIKIVDAKTLQEIDTKQAITRSLGYIASILILMVGFLMVAFRSDKRGLHDLLAGTIVIHEESKD